MALAFAMRYPALTVLGAISVATLLVHAGSVLLGAAAAATFPTGAVSVVAGLAFFGFAAWTLRGDRLGEREWSRADRGAAWAFFAIGSAFFLAELGDKTMLATVTLATREDALGTWLGSTAGMVAADAVAIAAGRLMGARLPERAIRWFAAAAFVSFGALLVAQGLGVR